MGVTRTIQMAWLAALALPGACAGAQVNLSTGAALPQAPSAVARPLVLTGGVQVAREQPGAVSLTLDEAIALGLKDNTELRVRTEQERYVHGQILAVGSTLVPNLRASGYTQAQEIDLVAMGFKPGSVKIPGVSIPEIVKVNTTEAQLSLSQQVFNVPAYLLYRSAQKAAEAANWATLSARGERGAERGRILPADPGGRGDGPERAGAGEAG